MAKLQLTVSEITHLIIIAGILDAETLDQIEDPAIRATALKVQAKCRWEEDGFISPSWEAVGKRRWF